MAARPATDYDGAMRAAHLGSGLGFLLVFGCASPELHFDAPGDGDDLFGAVRLVATTSGGEAEQVSFYVDAVDASHLLASSVAGADGGYEAPWFTADTGDGVHTLIAAAEVDGSALEASIEVTVANPTRAQAIPAGAVKQTPDSDQHPPVLEAAFAAIFEPCAPLPGPVTTAGAEDSPFITADGLELYTFFTPDASVPVNLQLVDGVTGIYRSVLDGDSWTEPERVWLSYYDDPSLDGCVTVYGDDIWFCTVRAGVEREIDIYRARRDADHFVDWASAGSRLNLELGLGELELADGGDTIYYHSERAGGHGATDIWVTRREGGEWSDPDNLDAVNSEYPDGYPWVSPDGQELWFTRGPAAPEIWRSVKVGDAWQPPEKVVGPFAGEPTFDAAGNLYFTHHFWDDATDSLLEADVYLCPRK